MKRILLLILLIPLVVHAQIDITKRNITVTGNLTVQGTSTIKFNGNRAITGSSFPTGQNFGDTDLVAFMNHVFFPSTSPTATINLGAYSLNREMASAGTDAPTINWSVTRPVACLALASTVVDGVTISPNPDPSEGGSVSNTQSGSVTHNSNKTFTVTVTSTDSKIGTASVTVAWYWKRYYGCFSSGTAPITGNTSWISEAQILSLTGSELSSVYAKNFGSVNCSSTYYVYAFPHAWGTPTFLVNTFPTTFVQVWINQPFTNASGGVTGYDVWVSPFPYAGTFVLVSQ